MSATEPTTGDRDQDSPPFDDPLPEYADWIAAGVIALAGLALTVAGSAVTAVVDRGLIESEVESGRVTVMGLERELTDAQMLEFALAVVNWVGIGLLVTGVGLVLFAIGYLVVRRRAHRRRVDGGPVGSYRALAVVGAVATTVLSFVPFSPVLGGGVAAYLGHPNPGRPISVGALSGFLAAVPALSIVVFTTIGVVDGFSRIQETGLGIAVAAGLGFAVLVVAGLSAGLGALGGFIGGRLAEDHA